MWTPSHGQVRVGDQLEPINNSSVLIQGVAWKPYREQWTIGTSSGRGTGKSVPASRHDDEDDIHIYIYVHTVVVIYKAFYLDVTQGHMNGAPHETQTYS